MEVPHLDHSTERRAAAVETITQALFDACPPSTVRLLGSLATGNIDPYSDIDLAWIVPDAQFESCLARAPAALAQAIPIRSLRIDPDLQSSPKRRLLFLRFVDLPLFWRVDLDIRVESIADHDDYDMHNRQTRGENWSLPASALENAVAAIKALMRNQEDVALGLLQRGYARIGQTYEPRDWLDDVIRLAEASATAEPGLQPLHREVAAVGRAVLECYRKPDVHRP